MVDEYYKGPTLSRILMLVELMSAFLKVAHLCLSRWITMHVY